MKENLLHEISDFLTSYPKTSLAPVLQKAIQLASVLRMEEYRLLFQIHLDGVQQEEKGPTRFQPWSNPEKTPKWDVPSAFHSDRAANEKTLGHGIRQLERIILGIDSSMEGMLDAPATKESITLIHQREEVQIVLDRIANRISAFVSEVHEQEDSVLTDHPPKNRIFLGHGGSKQWIELKDFLQDRLNLETDEFNRESPAGKTTVERLTEMISSAGFAFLILTAEDEHEDGSLHARENVIHEAGLFQGALGFDRAIVLIEEGCSEFSNITGLSQIRFTKGALLSKSEEIRKVLEREGLI